MTSLRLEQLCFLWLAWHQYVLYFIFAHILPPNLYNYLEYSSRGKLHVIPSSISSPGWCWHLPHCTYRYEAIRTLCDERVWWVRISPWWHILGTWWEAPESLSQAFWLDVWIGPIWHHQLFLAGLYETSSKIPHCIFWWLIANWFRYHHCLSACKE